MRPDLLDDERQDWQARGFAGAEHRCDVRDAKRIGEVVDAVVRQFGRIDVLGNNAGVAPGAPVEELSEETWDPNQDANLQGTFPMCRAVIPVMKMGAGLVGGTQLERECRGRARPRGPAAARPWEHRLAWTGDRRRNWRRRRPREAGYGDAAR